LIADIVRLLLLITLLAGATACATSGAVPRPFPGAPEPPSAPRDPDVRAPEWPGVSFDRDALVRTALGFRGVPYRDGGSDPSGFDCSGFVQYVFAQHGVGLPREVREQFLLGEQIDRQSVQPGDLVFFTTVARGASHVGVAISDVEFVHAPSSRGRVRVELFSQGYWATRIVGERRM
jgi:cell wall-associated NlpC family hydrolase